MFFGLVTSILKASSYIPKQWFGSPCPTSFKLASHWFGSSISSDGISTHGGSSFLLIMLVRTLHRCQCCEISIQCCLVALLTIVCFRVSNTIGFWTSLKFLVFCYSRFLILRYKVSFLFTTVVRFCNFIAFNLRPFDADEGMRIVTLFNFLWYFRLLDKSWVVWFFRQIIIVPWLSGNTRGVRSIVTVLIICFTRCSQQLWKGWCCSVLFHLSLCLQSLVGHLSNAFVVSKPAKLLNGSSAWPAEKKTKNFLCSTAI